MRLVIQRVTEAEVQIERQTVGRCQRGFMILCGVEVGDSQNDVDYCIEKTTGLRVFEDDAGKMNRSIMDVSGGALVVSQFTLLGDARHGRRPSFIQAARPDEAIPLYEAYCKGLREHGVPIETGVFGADMKVSLINDGPVTILIDSKRAF